MLKFAVSENKKSITLLDFSLNSERKDLFSFFKRTSKKAAFNVLVDRGIWDGKDTFITSDGVIKIGLWKEIYQFTKDYGYDCEIAGIDECLNLKLDNERYLKYVDLLLKGTYDEFGAQISARDYQIDGAFRALRYNFCTQELATSSGKTLLFYIFNSYLRDSNQIDVNNKALLIVPNVSLVTQTASKFELYSANKKRKWKVHTIGGDYQFDEKEFEACEICITTYQSLLNMTPTILDRQLGNLLKKKVKKGEFEKHKKHIDSVKANLDYYINYDLFKWFKVVNIDECHKSQSEAISDIIKSCKVATYKLGLSGTVKVDEKYSDFFRVQENVGPLVMVLSAKHLIDNNFASNIKIKVVNLKYNNSDPELVEYWELKKNGRDQYPSAKDYGIDMLKRERNYLFKSSSRLNFISALVKKVSKNTLILFSDVKNEYGKTIYSKISEWNKNTFYIAGEVKSKDRDVYKSIMESENSVVIVASFGTFATGIDLKNVHHIIFAESTKAEITIRQSIGRGMRLLAEKNEAIIWDLVDLLDGYMIKHGKIREEIYEDQQFEVTKSTIDISKY